MNKEVTIDIENPKDNDLISRQAVLDVINEAIRIGRFYCGKERTIEEIKTIPSVNPQEPKTDYKAFAETV